MHLKRGTIELEKRFPNGREVCREEVNKFCRSIGFSGRNNHWRSSIKKNYKGTRNSLIPLCVEIKDTVRHGRDMV